MSGGSMNYDYARLRTVAEELEASAGGGNHPGLRREVAGYVERAVEAVRAIEWSDSGDTGPEDWVPSARRLLSAAPPDRSRESAP
jgi:hypothetical protein